MANEHPFIIDRRMLQVAIQEQLNLARHARDNGNVPGMRRIEADANAEAGRLVNRLVRVQEKIEELDLD